MNLFQLINTFFGFAIPERSDAIPWQSTPQSSYKSRKLSSRGFQHGFTFKTVLKALDCDLDVATVFYMGQQGHFLIVSNLHCRLEIHETPQLSHIGCTFTKWEEQFLTTTVCSCTKLCAQVLFYSIRESIVMMTIEFKSADKQKVQGVALHCARQQADHEVPE